MLSSKAHWLALLESGRKSFGDLPLSLRTFSLCARMVRSDPAGVLRHAPERVRAHPDFHALCRAAVAVDGMALEYVPRRIHGYAVICFEAVQNNGMALAFVDGEAVTAGMCVEAVLNAPGAMALVPARLRSEVEAELGRG